MLQGKTKTNKQDTVKSLTPDQDAANFFSKGTKSEYFQLCVSVSIGAAQFCRCSVKVALGNM